MSCYPAMAGPEATAPGDMEAHDDLGAGLPSQALARLLLSGEVGLRLFHALTDQFPTMCRTEVFIGIALAWTDLQAALVAAEAQILDLRRRLSGAEAP